MAFIGLWFRRPVGTVMRTFTIITTDGGASRQNADDLKWTLADVA
jgi:hypothetical protein